MVRLESLGSSRQCSVRIDGLTDGVGLQAASLKGVVESFAKLPVVLLHLGGNRLNVARRRLLHRDRSARHGGR